MTPSHAERLAFLSAGLVHATSDGVFERRHNFFDVRRQLATALDVWPQRDRSGENRGGGSSEMRTYE